MTRIQPPDSLPEPPDHLKQLSHELLGRICARIADAGPIAFAEFMEMALYEPGLGYYSAGLPKLGREGDFITAPELGGVFGACLANQVDEISETIASADILEIGAGSGRLAVQILAAGATLRSRQSRPQGRSYRILERSADLRAVQQRTIADKAPEHAHQVAWLDTPPSDNWQGVLLANEVLDALSVERFRIEGETVRQVCVDSENGALKFTDRVAPAELEAAVRDLGPMPHGYCSEINLHLAPWLEAVTASLELGVAIFIDYGYPRREFYLPERSDGTLIAHTRHRAHDDVLRYPGLQDLTAFVDFTALAAAGRSAGLEILGYTNQALFLLGCGLDGVVQARLRGDAERDMAINNEVRHLMLPGLMGEKFQVMALGRGWPEDKPLRGFSFRDLKDRL